MPEEQKEPKERPLREDTELMEEDLEQLEELLNELEEAVRVAPPARLNAEQRSEESIGEEEGEEEQQEEGASEEVVLATRPGAEEERHISLPDI
ncbi:MAG TPA: hypothetical protein VF099_00525, partial [Ktedonobacterales bacterium]